MSTTTPGVSPDMRDSVPVALVLVIWRVVKTIVRETKCTCREAIWVLRALPRLVAFLVVLVMVGVVAGQVVLGFSVGVALVLLMVVLPRHTRSWDRVQDQIRAQWYRDNWHSICRNGGLSRSIGTTGTPVIPRLTRVTVRQAVATVTVRLTGGHTLHGVERTADELRTLLAAYALQVTPGPTPDTCVITITHVNHLVTPSDTPLPALDVDSTAIPIGRELDGTAWVLDSTVHTLVAGATGAGKGSVMWSTLIGLAPLVKTGEIRLIGIDLKRGVELTMGADLFTTLVTTETEAVAVLEREVTLMQARCDALAGVARKAEPSSTRTVLVLDEAAALQLLMSDRTLARRCEDAMKLLLTQGRAPGWTVLAFLQDPRLSSFQYRDLFPIGIALRLRTAGETEMILSEGLSRIAPAHHIPLHLQGTGYVMGEAGTARQVRAHNATDDTIRYVAANFAPPTTEPAPKLTPDPNKPKPFSTKASRKPRTPRAASTMNGVTP